MSVAYLDIDQRLTQIVDWELLALFLLDEHDAHGSLGDCEVNEELFPIFGLGEEYRRSEILLHLLESFLTG